MAYTEDNESVARIRAGEVSAFGELYDLYFPKIYRFVYYKVFNTEVAEDIVSDVFYKALDRIQTFDPEKGVFSAWLYRIARNAVIDHYRTRKSEGIEDIFSLPHEDRITEKLDAEAALAKVSEYLEALTPRQREIVTLRIWEELPYQEIAAIVGGSEGSVKMSFSRTIHDIREKFGPLALLCLLLLRP